MTHEVQQYRNQDTGAYRWAVLHLETRAWYFPQRYGWRAANQLCRELNARERAYQGLDPKFNRALAAITGAT